jgi:predicted nucleotidyltransferase
MALNLETIISKAKAYAEDAKRTLPVEKVFLYGSYAKGTASEQSDIDICFFLRNFGNQDRIEILTELLTVLCKHNDLYFEPNVFEMDDIPRGNPFVKEVLRTGIEIL